MKIEHTVDETGQLEGVYVNGNRRAAISETTYRGRSLFVSMSTTEEEKQAIREYVKKKTNNNS
jgi:hypothetical protein